MLDKAWQSQVDRVTERTALQISRALDKMAADLPKDASPDVALDAVMKHLAEFQPKLALAMSSRRSVFRDEK